MTSPPEARILSDRVAMLPPDGDVDRMGNGAYS